MAFALRPHGSGYSEKVLYAFQGQPNDGALPLGGAILRKGALFGSTFYGGNSTECGDGGCGTVFRVKVR